MTALPGSYYNLLFNYSRLVIEATVNDSDISVSRAASGGRD
jgi:hypothetical protein